jgi:AbrB family looped-hinge helix DNA binding protein
MKRTIEMPILHREIAEFLDPRIHEAAPGTPSFALHSFRIVVPREIRKRMGYEEGSPFEIIPITEGILLVPYNPIETFGNRVDALLSDVKETENYRGMPDDAREAIKTKLQELVEVMQTYHVRSVEKGGDE